MLKTFEPGKVYRIKKEHSLQEPQKHIFIFKCNPKAVYNGTIRIDFLEMGTGEEGYGHFTDPGVWEEV